MGFLEHIGSANLIITPVVLIVIAAVPWLNKRYAPTGRYILWIMVMVGLFLPFALAVRPASIDIPFAITVPVTGRAVVHMSDVIDNEQQMSTPGEGWGPGSFTGDVFYVDPPCEIGNMGILHGEGSVHAHVTNPAAGLDSWQHIQLNSRAHMANDAVIPGTAYRSWREMQDSSSVYSYDVGNTYTSSFFGVLWQVVINIPVGILIAGVYIFGVVAFVLRQVGAHIVVMRLLKRWRVPVSADIMHIFEATKLEMGIGVGVRLYQSKEVKVPMLAGLMKPAVYLADTKYGEDELVAIFRHELTHYKHRDLWYKLALVIVRALYWYNPAVHAMAGQACRDLETYCDHSVTVSMDLQERKFYSGVLLGMASANVKSPLTSHMSGSGKVLKQRIASILYNKKTSNKKVFFVVGTLLVFAGFFIGFRFVEPYVAYAEYCSYAYEHHVDDDIHLKMDKLLDQLRDIQHETVGMPEWVANWGAQFNYAQEMSELLDQLRDIQHETVGMPEWIVNWGTQSNPAQEMATAIISSTPIANRLAMTPTSIHAIESSPVIGSILRNVCERDSLFFDLSASGVMVVGTGANGSVHGMGELNIRDIIVEVDGRRVYTSSDIADIAREYGTATVADITLYRNGERVSVNAVIR